MFILIAHGSRDPEWRRSLENLTEALQSALAAEEVRLAYMQFDGPTLRAVVEEGRILGIRNFRLLPLFMASAGHVDKDIRPLVGELAQEYPDTVLHLLPPVGEHPHFAQLVRGIAEDNRK